SGFNTTDVVTKLMEIEKAPLTQLETKKTRVNSKSDAWREMNTRLNALEDAAYALQSLDMFRGTKATVGNEEAFTVTSTTGAVAAQYNISIEKLAKAQTRTSNAVTSNSAALNYTGTIKINGKEIVLESGDSLDKLAEKINKTADVNVNASVIKVEADKYKLVLNSKNTGKANEIVFEGDTTILTGLGLNDPTNITQPAVDAEITINGLKVFRSSNKIDDAIPNVTLTLKNEGESSDLNVEVDKDKIVNAVKTFVEKYNAVMDYINQNSSFSYDVNTKKGTSGALFGDSTLQNIQSTLHKSLISKVTGVPDSVGLLNLVGIKGKSGVEGAKSGQLEFDETNFRAKLDTNFDDVAKLFGSTDKNGVFKKMYDDLFEMTGVEGMISNKTKMLNKEIDDINEQITAMEERFDAKEKAYFKKFQAMELALSKLQSQGSWLSSQLANLSSE
ncbi:MAG TPA: flagellar filament capping protein FliD, partial [Bacillota bacterium]|nr:flagellar filament capping protein FliD [Bacillota bacterium]